MLTDQVLGFILNVMALLKYYWNLQCTYWYLHAHLCMWGCEMFSQRLFTPLANFSYAQGH